MATKPRHLKTPLQLWIGDSRKRLGLSPSDLAALTGVTEDTARGWESRGRPGVDALAALERRFGAPAPSEDALPEGQAAVAAALDRLGDRLVAAIEAQGQAQARSLDTLAELLGGALSQLAASLERRPDGSAGLPEVRPGVE